MQKTQSKSAFAALLLTVFIDLVGVGIAVPIFAALFFIPGGPFFHLYSPEVTNLLYGIFGAIYPLAQFFGAPIIGGLSDKYGRKKMLFVSIGGTFIGYIITAVGVLSANLALVFAGRLIDGFTGGNISIAMSAIADISDHKSRARNFGLIGMAFGVGFVIGPYIGGKLSDPSVISGATLATPFLFTAILTALNLLLIIFNFKETLLNKVDTEISLLTGLKNIRKALQIANIRTMFLVVFLMTFGFTFFTQFFQVYLIDKFQFTQGNIGDLFAYIGVWIAITQGLINRQLTTRVESKQILKFSLLGLAIAFPLLLLASNSNALYFLLPIVAIMQGLTQPNSTAVISNSADAKSQGEILGINQSVQALGQAIPPILAGLIISLSINLPVIVAGIVVFLAWLVYVLLFKPSVHQTFSEVVE